ncbi:hypothetical protein Tco_1411645 [Tanacetum coccineum]
MMMDPFTKKVLWDFWKKGDNQEGVIDEGFSDLEKANNDDEHEIAEIFRIETNLFDYETPLCTKFKEFNYLLKNGKPKWPTYSSNEDGFCNGVELPGMVRVGYMTYFQDHEWYDDLMDGCLKDEALMQKAIYGKSWGDATQSVINFYAWLKWSFRNIHELDYESLVNLQDCWWKVNDHECSPFTNWRDHIRGPYTNYYCNAQDEEEQEDKG